MKTYYRITSGQLSGVDTFKTAPSGWVESKPPSEELPTGQAYQWDSDSAKWTVGIDKFRAGQLIETLWSEADAMANKVADANARGRYLAWRIDTETPEPAKVLIIKVQTAMDSIWKQYSVARAAIVAGAEPDPITAPVDVPTFWDIAAAADTPQGAEHG